MSGLPIRNGDRHAAQIGLMSLDFLTNVNNFVISHLPNEKLKIRIGMHSGMQCFKSVKYCVKLSNAVDGALEYAIRRFELL